MTAPFVWFDNLSSAPDATTAFLKSLFGWQPQPMGDLTLLMGSDNAPFAGTSAEMDGLSSWIPYVEVDDLTKEAERAVAAGGVLVAENLVGPAGTATFVKDPGGAVLALWTRAAGA